MNLTDSEQNINCSKNERDKMKITANSNDTDIVSITENISRVRLTLEEIIAQDNDASRQQYLSPTPSPSPSSYFVNCQLSDGSSVSSSFPSETGSILSNSSSSVRSGFDNSSIFSTFKSFNDPFRGVNDEDFSNLDRYGFLNNKSFNSINEREFMELERRKL